MSQMERAYRAGYRQGKADALDELANPNTQHLSGSRYIEWLESWDPDREPSEAAKNYAKALLCVLREECVAQPGETLAEAYDRTIGKSQSVVKDSQ